MKSNKLFALTIRATGEIVSQSDRKHKLKQRRHELCMTDAEENRGYNVNRYRIARGVNHWRGSTL